MKYKHVLVGLLLVLCAASSGTAQDQTKPTPTVQDTTQKAKSLKLLLKHMEIEGWVEKPQMVYVVPGINPKVDDIVLERSFLDEILRPLNKDEFEKQNAIRRKSNILW